MAEPASFQELNAAIEQVLQAQTDDFSAIASTLGLNPLTDLAGANLSGVNLEHVDLSGANLRGTNLSNAKLGWAKLNHANLSGANLQGADLNATQLCRAILLGATLLGANVQGAHFGFVLGLTEMNKADLKARGATVKDVRQGKMRRYVGRKRRGRIIVNGKKLRKVQSQNSSIGNSQNNNR